jgi:hypothetical protein
VVLDPAYPEDWRDPSAIARGSAGRRRQRDAGSRRSRARAARSLRKKEVAALVLPRHLSICTRQMNAPRVDCCPATIDRRRVMLVPELLDRARAARADLEETDRRALLSRAEYHAAIRRLHLAGGSVREVAQALSLSHQRVQQIVQGAGGTWWRRMWRTRGMRPDAICTWCGRPPSEVAKLVAGPRVYICDACLAAAERAARGRDTIGSFSLTMRASIRRRCSFCGRMAGTDRPIVAAAAGHVCGACLQTCRQIVDNSLLEGDPPARRERSRRRPSE